jgi:hypothetical protein
VDAGRLAELGAGPSTGLLGDITDGVGVFTLVAAVGIVCGGSIDAAGIGRVGGEENPGTTQGTGRVSRTSSGDW